MFVLQLFQRCLSVPFFYAPHWFCGETFVAYVSVVSFYHNDFIFSPVIVIYAGSAVGGVSPRSAMLITVSKHSMEAS